MVRRTLLIVLAGGKGSRLDVLTVGRAKPSLPVGAPPPDRRHDVERGQQRAARRLGGPAVRTAPAQRPPGRGPAVGPRSHPRRAPRPAAVRGRRRRGLRRGQRRRPGAPVPADRRVRSRGRDRRARPTTCAPSTSPAVAEAHLAARGGPDRSSPPTWPARRTRPATPSSTSTAAVASPASTTSPTSRPTARRPPRCSPTTPTPCSARSAPRWPRRAAGRLRRDAGADDIAGGDVRTPTPTRATGATWGRRRPTSTPSSSCSAPAAPFRLDDPPWPVISPAVTRSPARIEGRPASTGSWVSPGSVVRGTVVDSIIGPGTVVERGAEVRHSVLYRRRAHRQGGVGGPRRSWPSAPGSGPGRGWGRPTPAVPSWSGGAAPGRTAGGAGRHPPRSRRRQAAAAMTSSPSVDDAASVVAQWFLGVDERGNPHTDDRPGPRRRARLDRRQRREGPRPRRRLLRAAARGVRDPAVG